MAGDQGFDEARPVRIIERIGNAQFGQRPAQAGPMLGPAKRRAIVDGDHFIDAVAKNESAVKHRDRGRGEWDKRPIEPADLVLTGGRVERRLPFGHTA